MAQVSEIDSNSHDESIDSSSSEESTKVGKKRKLKESAISAHRLRKKRRTKLPSLESLPNLFKNVSKENPKDDPLLHHGKQRRFVHQKGNWSTHIYISLNKQWTNLCERMHAVIAGQCSDDQLTHCIEDLHVSLSIAQPIHCSKINDFVQTMTDSVKCKSFEMNLRAENAFKCFSNPSGDRHFGALLIGAGKQGIIELIECCNRGLRKWGLKQYYDDPEPHISLIWSLQPFEFTVEQRKAIEIKMKEKCVNGHETMTVDNVVIKIGNRLYNIAF